MEYDCGFNTKLLHGKTSKGFPNREILPPISQVTAFRYDSMEELERVFLHKRMNGLCIFSYRQSDHYSI